MKVVFACNHSPIYIRGYTIVMGQHWLADDPIVQEHPELFTDDARYGLSASVPIPEDPVIEAATAAPGEKRVTRRADRS